MVTLLQKKCANNEYTNNKIRILLVWPAIFWCSWQIVFVDVLVEGHCEVILSAVPFLDKSWWWAWTRINPVILAERQNYLLLSCRSYTYHSLQKPRLVYLYVILTVSVAVVVGFQCVHHRSVLLGKYFPKSASLSGSFRALPTTHKWRFGKGLIVYVRVFLKL